MTNYLLIVYLAQTCCTSVELPATLPVCECSGSQDAEGILVELLGGVPGSVTKLNRTCGASRSEESKQGQGALDQVMLEE